MTKSEEQLLMDFIMTRPEFIEGVVGNVVREFVAGLLEERREEIRQMVDDAIEKHTSRLACSEYFNIFLEAEGAKKNVRPLGDAARDAARTRVASLLRIFQDDLMELRRDLMKLRDHIVSQDDADWWKRGEQDQEDSDE